MLNRASGTPRHEKEQNAHTKSELRRSPEGGREMTELTSRQRQVAELAADGHTVEEIAADLNISTSTTRSHLDAARRKLGVRRKREIGRALKASR